MLPVYKHTLLQCARTSQKSTHDEYVFFRWSKSLRNLRSCRPFVDIFFPAKWARILYVHDFALVPQKDGHRQPMLAALLPTKSHADDFDKNAHLESFRFRAPEYFKPTWHKPNWKLRLFTLRVLSGHVILSTPKDKTWKTYDCLPFLLSKI